MTEGNEVNIYLEKARKISETLGRFSFESLPRNQKPYAFGIIYAFLDGDSIKYSNLVGASFGSPRRKKPGNNVIYLEGIPKDYLRAKRITRRYEDTERLEEMADWHASLDGLEQKDILAKSAEQVNPIYSLTQHGKELIQELRLILFADDA